ncbi:tyrosine-type recombinase/integrase [Streptomyces sp. H34-S4]|uniref:tyrosine-type recombinase/integrase n=1 Tax=Streptomyces sp. H34-S4 TaxID=2996463 RepID=UPI0022719667|nr:tyrosine-type recombinase/integrase [Streptomyces sp. H34-S4]MCY0933674.1 tyrosine-type recombinase/integrase [Streptomyces sp. H34-S4]
MASVFQKCKTDKKHPDFPCEKTRCGHAWTVRYREPGGRGGRQREKTFDKKADADKFHVRVERDKDVGSYIDPDGAKKQLVRVFEEFIAVGDTTHASKHQYTVSLNRHIRPHFGGQTIGSIKPADIQSWLKWMTTEAGYAQSTTVVRYRVLASVFNFAVNNDYIAKNPCHRVKVKQAKVLRQSKKKIQIPTLVEIAAIAENLPKQNALMTWLMAGAGLRVGEALAVTLAQVDSENGFLYVDRQIAADGENGEPVTRSEIANTKGQHRALRIRHLKSREQDEGRKIPIGGWLVDKIQDHVDQHGTFRVEEGFNRMAGDYLFSNAGRTNIASPSYLTRWWTQAVKDAGLGRQVKRHWCRHFFASAALSRGVPVHEVAEWLGHTDPRVTFQMYSHVMPDAPGRLRVVMDSIFTGTDQLELPEEVETLARDEL